MIKLIIENTDCFMNAVPKAKRKKYGQFFTNVTTALYMASLFDFDTTKPQISFWMLVQELEYCRLPLYKGL